MPVCLLTLKEEGLNYYKTGSGKAIVLLHGWGASGELMLPIARAIPNYTYVVPDLYGHGHTRHPDRPLTLDDYVSMVMILLKREKVDKAIFICHSFGGRIGIKIATRYPEVVERLILCDSAGLRPKKGFKYYTKRLNYIIRKRFGFSLDRCGSADFRVLKGEIRNTFKNVVAYHQDDEINDIKCPTLIVWGKKDKDTPMYMAKRLNKKINGSKLVVMKGVGHFSYAEDLKTFKRIVTKFLES